MKTIFFCIGLLFLIIGVSQAQSISPDKFITKMLKDDSAMGLTLPGWIIKKGAKIAISDEMDKRESDIIKELTGSIKKLRIVVSEKLPSNYSKELVKLKNYFIEKSYEPLIEVRDGSSDISLWGQYDNNLIKNLVITVIDPNAESVFINIKSKINVDKLKSMNFYRELESL